MSPYTLLSWVETQDLYGFSVADSFLRFFPAHKNREDFVNSLVNQEEILFSSRQQRQNLIGVKPGNRNKVVKWEIMNGGLASSILLQ